LEEKAAGLGRFGTCPYHNRDPLDMIGHDNELGMHCRGGF